jgi:uncharacterized membrane protein YozB (DUF420 family)
MKNLPTLNAVLNLISFMLLIRGYRYIKTGDRHHHRQMMMMALFSSVLFLISYLTYHYQVGSVPYPLQDWTRILYLIILVPHIILAGLMGPFILIAVSAALWGNFELHRRVVKWVFPVWLYVCLSGVTIYAMLYYYPGGQFF